MEGTAVTREEVREASGRLPERQREALELRDGGERSYEGIAASLEMSPSAVAQLIAHARINLYDELRGTALASVAPSPDCERALPLIAMREDGQLAPSFDDADWLDSHLAACERCALAVEQMREAALAYRAQGPDRSSGEPVQPPAVAEVPGSTGRHGRRAIATVVSAALLLLLAGLAVAFTGNDRPTPAEPASGAATGHGAEGSERDAKRTGAAGAGGGSGKSGPKKGSPTAGSAIPLDGAAGTTAAAAATPTPGSSSGTGDGQEDAPGSGPGGTGPKGAPGQTAVEPTRQTAATRPGSEPKPAPTSAAASQPVPTPAPAPAPESPPAEEPADRPGRSDEAPGKPHDRPSK
jgi:hypothetical protein